MAQSDVKLELHKCGLCGKAFVGAASFGAVCSDCKEDEDRLYRKARALIRDNPDKVLHIADAARLLKVDEHKIMFLVSKGYIQLSNSAIVGVR